MSIISIDFFGTLDVYPVFWREMLSYVILEGIKVYVISGPAPNAILSLLKFNGYTPKVHFTNVVSIFSHLAMEGESTWYSEAHDSYRCVEETYWNSKAEICHRLGSQIHFDNDTRFGHAFGKVPTRFVHNAKEPGKALIKEWHNSLKLANAYEEWEEDFMYMNGFFPM